jgi:hypothetical protein
MARNLESKHASRSVDNVILELMNIADLQHIGHSRCFVARLFGWRK